jgi:hypothetical protein
MSMAGTAMRAGLISERPARIEDDNRGFAALSRSRALVMSYAARVFISSPKQKQGAYLTLPRSENARPSIVSKLSIRACVSIDYCPLCRKWSNRSEAFFTSVHNSMFHRSIALLSDWSFCLGDLVIET